MSEYDDQIDEYEELTTSRALKSARMTDNYIELDLRFEIPNEETIAQALAMRLLSDYTLGKELRANVNKLILDKIEEQINLFISDLIEKQLVREFPVINPASGEATGEHTSFRQKIADYIASWQTQYVNNEGKPVQLDSWNRNSAKTREQWLIQQVAGAAFEKEAKAAVAAVMQEAKTTQAEKLKAIVSQALGAVLK